MRYVPEAQGSFCQWGGPRYVRRTPTSRGRTARDAYRVAHHIQTLTPTPTLALILSLSLSLSLSLTLSLTLTLTLTLTRREDGARRDQARQDSHARCHRLLGARDHLRHARRRAVVRLLPPLLAVLIELRREHSMVARGAARRGGAPSHHRVFAECEAWSEAGAHTSSTTSSVTVYGSRLTGLSAHGAKSVT
jgi:hypothetical protein